MLSCVDIGSFLSDFPLAASPPPDFLGRVDRSQDDPSPHTNVVDLCPGVSPRPLPQTPPTSRSWICLSEGQPAGVDVSGSSGCVPGPWLDRRSVGCLCPGLDFDPHFSRPGPLTTVTPSASG